MSGMAIIGQMMLPCLGKVHLQLQPRWYIFNALDEGLQASEGLQAHDFVAITGALFSLT